MSLSSSFSKSFKAGKRIRRRFSLSVSSSDVNEGAEVVVTLNTKRIRNGKSVAYTITGISASDLISGSLTGSFAVSGGSASITLILAQDSLTEGLENMTISLNNNRSSRSISIADTSISGPTYSISYSGSTISEGSSKTITVNTTGVSNGTNLYWTILNDSSSNSDFSSVSGSTSINSNSGSFSISASSDSTTEGTERFRIQLRTGSISGAVVATSSYISILDTSITPSAWNPDDMSNLVAWVDASDSSSYSSSRGELTSVTDKARVHTFSIGGTPTVVSRGLNGLDLFDFSGNSEYIQSTGFPSQTDGSGNHWAIGVFLADRVDNSKDSLWSYETSSSPKRDYAVSSGTSENSWNGELDLDSLSSSRISSSIGNSELWSSGMSIDNWHIVAVFFNKSGNQIGQRLDGQNIFTPVNDYDNSISERQQLRLMRNRSSQELDGRLAEFFAVAGIPGSGDTNISNIEKAEGYLAHKWGLTSILPDSHTYKSSAP